MLPIIDLKPFFSDSPEKRKQVGEELVAGCRKYGFVYIKNYTLDEEILNQAYGFSRQFFESSDDDKMKAPHPPGFTHHRGYLSVGKEKVKEEDTGFVEPDEAGVIPDYKETLDIGHSENPTQPNIWPPPDVVPGFQEFMDEFFIACHEAGCSIIEALSVGMDLPQDFFTSKLSSVSSQLRLLRYPSIPEADFLNHSKTRFSAHADWSFLTILFQDECGGLEVEDPDHPGDYIPVDPIPGTLVMNVGDVLKRWTNDSLKSALHRVGPPATTGDKMTRERYSIPYFMQLDAEVVIETLPKFITKENPKKYKPINVVDYLTAKAQGQDV